MSAKHWVAVELGDEKPSEQSGGLPAPAPVIRRFTRHTTRQAAISAARKAAGARAHVGAVYDYLPATHSAR
jgi:hypothetical protein